MAGSLFLLCWCECSALKETFLNGDVGMHHAYSSCACLSCASSSWSCCSASAHAWASQRWCHQSSQSPGLHSWHLSPVQSVIATSLRLPQGNAVRIPGLGLPSDTQAPASGSPWHKKQWAAMYSNGHWMQLAKNLPRTLVSSVAFFFYTSSFFCCASYILCLGPTLNSADKEISMTEIKLFIASSNNRV